MNQVELDAYRRGFTRGGRSMPDQPPTLPPGPGAAPPSFQLASEQVVIQSSLSFTGSAVRIWKLSRSDPRWVFVPLAMFLVTMAWTLVAAYYLAIALVSAAFLGIPVIVYRAIRRGQRKRKLEALRHRELMERLDQR